MTLSRPGWRLSPTGTLKALLSFSQEKAWGGHPRTNTQASALPQSCPEVLTEPFNKSETFPHTLQNSALGTESKKKIWLQQSLAKEGSGYFLNERSREKMVPSLLEFQLVLRGISPDSPSLPSTLRVRGVLQKSTSVPTLGK